MKHFHIQIIHGDQVVDYHPCLLGTSRIAPLNKLRKLEPAALIAFEKTVPVLVNFIEYIQFAFNERASVLTCKHCFRKNASQTEASLIVRHIKTFCIAWNAL